MGLVVIVILISLALLFVVQFVILRGPDQAKATFTQKQIAENTANALLLTTTSCQGLDVTELIQDCAGFQDVSCDGQDSCTFVDGLAEDILQRTLKEWGKNYNLSVMSGTQELVGAAYKGCKGARDVSLYPIPSRVIGGDKIFVRLEVCG